MNNPIIRKALAVLAGVIAGGFVVFCVEMLGHRMFPPPPGMNLSNPADMQALMASLPAAAVAFIIVGWIAGSLVAALVAVKIARTAGVAWIVAGIFMALTAMNFLMIPHPAWMIAAGLAIPLATAWIATRSARTSVPLA